MITAFKSLLSGCLWALVGFTIYSLSGFILDPLGLADFFIRGEPGEQLQATPLALVTCAVLTGAGFLYGIHRAYRPLLRDRQA